MSDEKVFETKTDAPDIPIKQRFDWLSAGAQAALNGVLPPDNVDVNSQQLKSFQV